MVPQQQPATDGGVLEGEVPSESQDGVTYTVMSDPASGRWKCTCPDYVMRRRFNGTDCKHIRAIKEAQQQMQQQQQEQEM